MYLLKSKKILPASILSYKAFPYMLKVGERGFDAGAQRCLDSPPHPFFSKKVYGLYWYYQAFQLQETWFSEAETEEEAEGKKEAVAPHFVNQAAKSSNWRTWHGCLFQGVQGRTPVLYSVSYMWHPSTSLTACVVEFEGRTRTRLTNLEETHCKQPPLRSDHMQLAA